MSGKLLVYRIIVVLILVIVAILIAGTVYSLVRPSGSAPLFRIGTATEDKDDQVSDNGEIGIFSGIGRLRIPVAGSSAATAVLSVSFPYPAGDRLFTEELASRTGEFRSIAVEYFSSLTREEIVSLDEEAAKAGILGRYNDLLRLGKIETLYFGDLMIVE
jgi:flagellar basal body-associated protein FliL